MAIVQVRVCLPEKCPFIPTSTTYPFIVMLNRSYVLTAVQFTMSTSVSSKRGFLIGKNNNNYNNSYTSLWSNLRSIQNFNICFIVHTFLFLFIEHCIHFFLCQLCYLLFKLPLFDDTVVPIGNIGLFQWSHPFCH